jgi:hypothetical protein
MEGLLVDEIPRPHLDPSSAIAARYPDVFVARKANWLTDVSQLMLVFSMLGLIGYPRC